MAHAHRTGFRRIWYFPPLPPQASVCEIGTGAGDFARACAMRGWAYDGMDPVAPASRPPGAWSQCKAENFCWPNTETYDAIFAWQALEHLDNPRWVLERARGALHESGYVCVSVPNTRCLERWIMQDRWDGWRTPAEHKNHWDARQLGSLLRRTGFRVERVLYQRQVKQIPGGLLAGTVLAALGLSSRMVLVARPD